MMAEGRRGGASTDPWPSVSLVTCGPQLEVGLRSPDMATTSVVRLGGASPRSTLVLAAVDLLLEDAALRPEDLATIVVSRGPGSFTGIRAGLATAAGISAATGARTVHYDSLLMLAARCDAVESVWSAQPGRQGEVYARRYAVGRDSRPRPLSDIEIVALDEVARRGPWIAAEALDLGSGLRAPAARACSEALLELLAAGVNGDPGEPLYVEGPPIQSRDTDS